MNKTKIEWCDYTINPVKGLCPMACPYCYARRMYKRFRWNPEIRYEELFYYPGIKGSIGDKYFVGSTMELFGEWIRPEWLEDLFMWVRAYPQRTFIFLTKKPENLYKWSPFPDNCWVGVSASDNDMAWSGASWLDHIEAGIKYISFEPLLAPMRSKDERLDYSRAIVEKLDWLIIGQQTPINKNTEPKIEWIKDIEDAADRARIPVFEKNNLDTLLKRPLRQEFP